MARKKGFPGPQRGTPEGDARVGVCQGWGCGRIVYRGDRFVCLMGDALVCAECHELGMPVNMPEASKEKST